MKQENLQFGVGRTEHLQCDSLKSQEPAILRAESTTFQFIGRGIPRTNYRKGQFQYRYGKKVEPKDEYL